MKLIAILVLSIHVALADEQLLSNSGFEDDGLGSPEGWQNKIGFGTATVALAQAAPQEGKTHLSFSVITDNSDQADGGPGTGPGRIAVEQVTPGGSITGGANYTFSFFSTSPTGFFPTVAPRYHIEWFDASNLMVASTEWIGFTKSVGHDSFYEEFSTELTAPAEADHVRIFFDLEGGDLNNPDSVETALSLDNITLRPAKAVSGPPAPAKAR